MGQPDGMCKVNLVSPLVALTVLEPEDARRRIGRVMFYGRRLGNLTLIAAEVDIGVRVPQAWSPSMALFMGIKWSCESVFSSIECPQKQH